MNLAFTSAVFLFLSLAALGQSTTAPPVFDAADVHVSKPGTPTSGAGFLPGGRFEVHGFTMLELIMMAYSVKDDERIVGGPGWLDTDGFDVIAKGPSSSSKDVVQLMLQALLADRFKLAIHPGTRPLPAFVLTIGKRNPQLKDASGSAENCQASSANGMVVVQCRATTMAKLAEQLPGWAGAYLRHPVVDMTGLKGAYDFTLRWTPRARLGAAGGGDAQPASNISVFEAVEKQLGLKLEATDQPAPVIVVDHVEQKPTDN